MRSRPSRAGASPPRRIRRCKPTPSGSRPPGASSASGWHGNYPFHHPRYAGQMLKPPHPVAIAAYTAAHARQHQQPRARRRAGDERDGGRGRRATGGDVRPAGRRARAPDLLAARSPTSRRCGWRASCIPARPSCYGANAHYTHSRMCAVLGVRGIAAPADVAGRIDLDAVEELCRAGDVGTVVVTAGTTGTGTRRRRRAGGRLPRDATACGCTSTPPTAASSRCSRTPG